jgi:hypothetical protein
VAKIRFTALQVASKDLVKILHRFVRRRIVEKTTLHLPGGLVYFEATYFRVFARGHISIYHKPLFDAYRRESGIRGSVEALRRQAPNEPGAGQNESKRGAAASLNGESRLVS